LSKESSESSDPTGFEKRQLPAFGDSSLMPKGVVKNPNYQGYLKDPKIKEWLGALKAATREAYG
jgi:hypothetical protein